MKFVALGSRNNVPLATGVLVAMLVQSDKVLDARNWYAMAGMTLVTGNCSAFMKKYGVRKAGYRCNRCG